MKAKIYPVIVIEGHFKPMEFFYRNRNHRDTVQGWLDTLGTLKEYYLKANVGSQIDSFEHKEFSTPEEEERFVKSILIADCCWSDSFSRYALIRQRQIILPEQDIREYLIEKEAFSQDSENRVTPDGPCFVDCILEGSGSCAVIQKAWLDPSGGEIRFQAGRISDNAVFTIGVEDLKDPEEGLRKIWEGLPIHPFVLEKNTPAQKHIRTFFDSVADAYREMSIDYHDELRDNGNASLAVEPEHLFLLASRRATVRWREGCEYTWRIYDRRNPQTATTE